MVVQHDKSMQLVRMKFLGKEKNIWGRHLTKIGNSQLPTFIEIDKSYQCTMACDTCSLKPSQGLGASNMAQKWFQAMMDSFGIPLPLKVPTPSKAQPIRKHLKIVQKIQEVLKCQKIES